MPLPVGLCKAAISAWNALPSSCHLPPNPMLYYLSPKLQITSSLKQKELFPPLGPHRTLLQAWDATVK